jgi:serine/threonine protein kinase
MEYVCNGELFHYLYHTHGFSEVSLRIIVRQIVDGLLWLKKFNLSHNDLKPENILLDEYFIVRLADYGFARAHSTDCTEYISGTRMYTSPEINEKRPYDTEKADMFSLGVIM